MRDFHARISPKKRDQILKCFAHDLTATQAAQMCKLNRNTANAWYRYFRTFIQEQTMKTPRFAGHIEMDQAFFRTRKRKRYIRVSEDKVVPKPEEPVAVFGIIERAGKVYTHIINRMDRRTLMPIIHLIVEPGSTIYTDEWRSFIGLDKDGYIHHKINHRRGFAKKAEGININTIEGFWSYAKRRLAKFNGIAKSTIHLHIKECEYRYNNKGNIGIIIKKAIKAEEKELTKKVYPIRTI